MNRPLHRIVCLAMFCIAAALGSRAFASTSPADAPRNLAPFATATTSYVSPHETLGALNSGYDPKNSNDHTHGAYGNWPRTGTQWVQLTWPQPVGVGSISVYWFADHRGIALPAAARVLAWDGQKFSPVQTQNNATLGLAANGFNTLNFSPVHTDRLRLEFDSSGSNSTGILQWKVLSSGELPPLPPKVSAGVDRDVVMPAQTFLTGSILTLHDPPAAQWTKVAGPGEVTFADPTKPQTTATFSEPGDYRLALIAHDGSAVANSTLIANVSPPLQLQCLTPNPMQPWSVDSPLWNDRLKALITHWIPHCIAKLEEPDLPQGGIQNFVNAANKLAGKPYQPNLGPVFCNAWVHNTVESMCWALMLDPHGDADLIRAQQQFRATLDDWIPKILAAQESDGYLDTYYTLHGKPRWTNKWDHEGYNAGYFIEAAIAHYEMTNGRDRRLYDAAKRLADCWNRNVGPDSGRTWYDGHECIERALVRFSHLVDRVDGPGKGGVYATLAKRLLDNRGGGESYDQSQSPVIQQYDAVGHAVRAVYLYSAMATVAAETNDAQYLSAVHSIWDDLVNRKYYIIGGVGSGETSEGFGPDYSLPNNAYCESCSGCGEIFFQHDLQLAYHDARYAELYSQTLFNAVLSDIDLTGDNFTYTNPLDSTAARYAWHTCPCCVSNISRTLLQLPTWMYSTSPSDLYVNLFAGSAVSVPNVAGQMVQVVQKTDYPWSGKVAITLAPEHPARFALHVRIPNPAVSTLYSAEPPPDGLKSMKLNGADIPPTIADGYAVIDRTWSPGDRIELELPMVIQRIKANPQVHADRGHVALRYGPLVFNIESVDQNVNNILADDAPLTTQWDPTLLHGVITIRGTYTNGQPLLAIPNYARNNRGGRSLVWVRDE